MRAWWVWAVAALAVAGLAGCGAVEPDAQLFDGLVAHSHHSTGSVVFRGAVQGSWRPSTSTGAICAPAQVKIPIVGPGPGDSGTLAAYADGSVYLDVERYGDFLGEGAVFHRGRGFEVDSDIETLTGKLAHVTGRLAC